MGQKVNPIGLRLGINKTWDSRWCIKLGRKYAETLNEDLKIRAHLRKKYPEVAEVEIERAAHQVILKLKTAKPGKLIGKQGDGIKKIQDDVTRSVLKSNEKSIKVNIFEIKNPDANAQLVASSIALQLEKRVSFRRAMKMSMQKAMKSPGVEGIKVYVSGRLNGADMARRERYMEGTVPLHTLRANIDYATAEAQTTYGKIGIKVIICMGEVYKKNTNPNFARKEE